MKKILILSLLLISCSQTPEGRIIEIAESNVKEHLEYPNSANFSEEKVDTVEGNIIVSGVVEADAFIGYYVTDRMFQGYSEYSITIDSSENMISGSIGYHRIHTDRWFFFDSAVRAELNQTFDTSLAAEFAAYLEFEEKRDIDIIKNADSPLDSLNAWKEFGSHQAMGIHFYPTGH